MRSPPSAAWRATCSRATPAAEAATAGEPFLRLQELLVQGIVDGTLFVFFFLRIKKQHTVVREPWRDSAGERTDARERLSGLVWLWDDEGGHYPAGRALCGADVRWRNA